jgi:Tfp pilus assembly protein PilN
MVQFNLLPDVKIEYIKAERTKRLVLSLSFIVTASAVALLVLLLSVDGLQKKHLSDLSKDITKDIATLQNKPNINTILTVQNQLESLTTLHDQSPAASRLADYLNAVTPSNVSINTLSIDFTTNTVTISGSTDTLSSVNRYVDTLKLTAYVTKDNSNKTPAFTNVVLSSFGVSGISKDKNQAASFTVVFGYDKTIFDVTKDVALSVPSITTRAQLQTPSDLFKTQEAQ